MHAKAQMKIDVTLTASHRSMCSGAINTLMEFGKLMLAISEANEVLGLQTAG
jgi:hypothetical protein